MPETKEAVQEEAAIKPPRMDSRQFWQRTGAICLTVALSIAAAGYYVAERTDNAIKKQGDRVNSSIKEPLDDVKADGKKARQYAERASRKLDGLDEEDLEKLGEFLATLDASGVISSPEDSDELPDNNSDQPASDQTTAEHN